MKKTFCMFALITAFSLSAHAQNAGNYGDLVVYRLFLKNYVAELHINGNCNRKKTLLKDTAGSNRKFASQIDALNYVSSQGWVLVSSYSERGGDAHFILKK